MQPNEITEVLNRPISRELLARDVTRLAYVAKDGTPRNVPIGFVWNGAELVGEVAQYQDSYRLCYVRGPEGIIVALAEQLS